MNPHDTKTRLGIENLEARDCPSGLTTSFSWGEFHWGCAVQSNPNEAGTSLVAATNPSNGEPSSIPTDQFSIALAPTRG